MSQMNPKEVCFPQHCMLSSTTLNTRSLPLNLNSQRKDVVLKTLNIKKTVKSCRKIYPQKKFCFVKTLFLKPFSWIYTLLTYLDLQRQGKNTAGTSKSNTPYSHLKTLSFRSPSQTVRSPSQTVRSLHNLRTVNYGGFIVYLLRIVMRRENYAS